MGTIDGGPAFPTPYLTRDGDQYSTEYESGMTLRDYFAAKAMATMLHGERAALLTKADREHWLPMAAVAAYEAADAMLAARGAA